MDTFGIIYSLNPTYDILSSLIKNLSDIGALKLN